MYKLTTFSVLIVVSFVLSLNGAESASVGEFMTGAKSYLTNLVRDGIISRSTVLSSFDSTMTNIRERYEQAKQNGELEGKDEAEASVIYYKIVVDEVRALREKLSAEKGGADGFIEACSLTNKNVDKYVSEYDVDMMDMGDDEEDEDDLMNELNELESNRDSEMGWSLDPESKAALKQRTLAVLADLVQNELKNVVMIIVTSLCAGGPAAGPVTAALNVSVKFKLLELLTNNLMDMLAAMLGKKIEPQMVFSAESTDKAVEAN